MKLAPLPDFAADSLLSQPTHPSGLSGAIDRSVLRSYRLIALALADLKGVEWLIDDAPTLRSATQVEPFGLQRFDHGYCVYVRERGKPGLLAVFKTNYLAADYFVHMVSRGQRRIDWTQLGELEP